MRVLLALFAHAGRITSITSRTQPGCCTIRNPGEKQVEFTLGAEPRDRYDAVAKEFVRRGVRGVVRVTIPADTARVLVVNPGGGKRLRQGSRLLINGVVVDFGHPGV